MKDELKENEENAPSIARNLIIIFAVVILCAMAGAGFLFLWISLALK